MNRWHRTLHERLRRPRLGPLTRSAIVIVVGISVVEAVGGYAVDMLGFRMKYLSNAVRDVFIGRSDAVSASNDVLEGGTGDQRHLDAAVKSFAASIGRNPGLFLRLDGNNTDAPPRHFIVNSNEVWGRVDIVAASKGKGGAYVVSELYWKYGLLFRTTHWSLIILRLDVYSRAEYEGEGAFWYRNPVPSILNDKLFELRGR